MLEHVLCANKKWKIDYRWELLVPHLVPEQSWDMVTMLFGSMIFVFDWFWYATFFLEPKDCSTDYTATLFFKNVYSIGMCPKYCKWLSYPSFMGKLWMELLKLLVSDLYFSSSFHSQANGKWNGWMHYWSVISDTFFFSSNQGVG